MQFNPQPNSLSCWGMVFDLVSEPCFRGRYVFNSQKPNWGGIPNLLSLAVKFPL